MKKFQNCIFASFFLFFSLLVGCSFSPQNTSSPTLLKTTQISTAPFDFGKWKSDLILNQSPSDITHPTPPPENETTFYLRFQEDSFQKEISDFKMWTQSQDFQVIEEKVLKLSVPQKIEITIQRRNLLYHFKIKQKKHGKVAIVIDDLGHNRKYLPLLYKLDCPMTLAILPHLTFSERLSKELHEHGYEVLLHLPMENTSKLDPGPGAITTQMTEEEIRKTITENLSDVPDAIGANNHMGSKATQDTRVMGITLDELKKHDKIFLDSLTAKSVATELAKERGDIIHSRDIFLDNQNSVSYIENQLKLLKKIAARRGQAIGIGHFKANTLQAILNMKENFEDAGIKFVFLSEFYKQKNNESTHSP